ncbi:MAG: adenosine deaminase, adenosine deaminase [Candidatus Peregrinibacteria bacterium GW2011_GWF2_43_17]|nr:MAG: adenosine deaminase, adenosine deaminase [Candidatus Peregrinibacteria bacterium GW2011_GWF2_43_17]KKT19547.1 MAG: Adenosine deaminase [Candidatus Peregrinibacteria bacterium GW2011_GWA2_43_8]HAU40387.1 hypothetical protein [Candidatus Peregrinibacteria bacterium]
MKNTPSLPTRRQVVGGLTAVAATSLLPGCLHHPFANLTEVPLVDPHVHSDTSHSPESILRVANMFGVPAYKGRSVEEVRADIQAPPGADWNTWYDHMKRTRQAYVSPEAIGVLIEDVLRDAGRNGVSLIELRISLISTVQALLDNLGIQDPQERWKYTILVFDQIIEAAQRANDVIQTDLVVSISSQSKYRSHVPDLIKFCRDYRTHIIGLDITNERDLPPSTIAREIESIRGDIRFLTVHCMEVMPPERGWDALASVSPDRIGHGIRAIEDPKLVEELVSRRIPLEMCVRSNLVTGTVSSLAQHPIRRLHDAGVTLMVGSDGCNDGSTLKDDYKLIGSMGFSAGELAKLRKNSHDLAFRNMV